MQKYIDPESSMVESVLPVVELVLALEIFLWGPYALSKAKRAKETPHLFGAVERGYFLDKVLPHELGSQPKT